MRLRHRARSYVMPPRKAGFDAECLYWGRASEATAGFDAHLGDAVRAWLAAEWPWWPRVAFPGRDQSWDAWAALPDA
jgi:hypothetical protein